MRRLRVVTANSFILIRAYAAETLFGGNCPYLIKNPLQPKVTRDNINHEKRDKLIAQLLIYRQF
jgi:hypothetical protein